MKKLYVLTRKDLSKPQQAVQSCHAVAQHCLNKGTWGNEILVLLGVPKLKDLDGW